MMFKTDFGSVTKSLPVVEKEKTRDHGLADTRPQKTAASFFTTYQL